MRGDVATLNKALDFGVITVKQYAKSIAAIMCREMARD